MIVDIVVGAVVLISALISFMRGFIREVLTIIGVVGGILAAYFIGPSFIPIVNGWYGIENGAEEIPKIMDLIPLDIAAAVTAYAIIFLVVVAVLSVASHFLAAGAKAVGLGPVDRTLGVIFGIARALVLLGLLYIPFQYMKTEDKEKLFAESKTHIFVEKTSSFLHSFFPGGDDVDIPQSAEDRFKKSLMEQELLKDKNKKKSEKPEENSQTGYENEQRDDMNKLFETSPSKPRYNE